MNGKRAFSAAVRAVVGTIPLPITINAGEGIPVLPPVDFNPDSLQLLRPLPAFAHERTELAAWRLFGRDVAPFLDRVLAAQGDAADPQIISLQHSLAELLRSPANNSPER